VSARSRPMARRPDAWLPSAASAVRYLSSPSVALNPPAITFEHVAQQPATPPGVPQGNTGSLPDCRPGGSLTHTAALCADQHARRRFGSERPEISAAADRAHAFASRRSPRGTHALR